MKKSLILHEAAKLEYLDAKYYYSFQYVQLGTSFKTEILSALEYIRLFPEIGADIDHGIKRFLVNRFPFSIFYKIYPTQIVVFAIASHHREPNYWTKRF